MALQKYAKATLPYYGQKDLVVEDHVTGDIIREIKKGHRDYLAEYDEIADEFWTGDVGTTAERLYNVLKKYVTYDVEHEDNQAVKSPGAIIQDGHGDCKHYASFICGIADALARQGKDISCKYRFVADAPGQTVHHVFAVLSDGRNEYWVDPVLNSFNAQPHFFETKDVPMALYRVSGTDKGVQLAERPHNLPLVGYATMGNIFKDIAHGIQVNAANAGKGVKQAAHDVAKGAQNTVKKVEHVALNVGLAPARNAFLALLDLNAFNLATRMSDAWTNHQQQVAAKWKELGGDQNKLLAAINNGRKHKAFYHNQAPAKKLSGDFNDFLAGCTAQVGRHRVEHMQVPSLIQAYYIGPDHSGRLPVVAGIGEPVSVATLSALAAAIISAFSQWMKPDKGDQNALDAAKDGVANIITNASDAIDAGQTAQGAQLLNAANAGAQAINTLTASGSGSMQVAAGVGPDGAPTVAVTDFSHPQLTNAGTVTPTSYVDPNAMQPYAPQVPQTAADQVTDKITDLPGAVGTDIAQWVQMNIIAPAKRIWHDYKTPIVFAAVGIGAYKIATRKKKRRR